MLGKLAAELKLRRGDGSYEIAQHRARRRLGRRGRLAAGRGRRRREARRAHRRGQRPAACRASRRRSRCSCTRRAPRSSSRSRAAARRAHVLVSTLADEAPARYREWVERNRAWVHEHSQGRRSATCTCPTCSRPASPSSIATSSPSATATALIVDVRYNRGGHVSQLLLEKLARRRIGYDLQRWGRPQPYPAEAAARAGGRADQRARGQRRRHLLALLQADEARHARRQAHLGRRHRHLAAPQARRRQRDDAAGVLVLVRGRRLEGGELRHRSGHRHRQRAAGRRGRTRCAARERARDRACARSPSASRRCPRSARARCCARTRCRRGPARRRRSHR